VTSRRRSSALVAGLALVVLVLVGAAAGSASALGGTDGTPVVTRLGVPANDLAFDQASNTLYASVPSRAGALGNRVVAIDPATGAVRDSVFVGSEPGRLALSADGQYLYVGLNGAAAVRRVALPSLTPGLQFSLGADSIFGPYLVEDMAVLPDNPNAVAVSRMNVGFSPRHGGVAIYDNGVKRTDETPRHTGSNVIEFGSSPGRLYGYNNETTEFGFRRMNVGPTGVSTVDATQNLISGFGVDIEFGGDKVFSTTGRVIDPESRTLLGTFSGANGPVEPDLAHGKVFYLSSGNLQAFDPATYTPLQSFPISGISGSASSLVTIGRSDLAFRTSGDQIFLVHFQAAPDTTPPAVSTPADVDVDATGPAGAVVDYATPSATDDVDGPVPVDCTPAPGATFPIGTSIVVCTAHDAAGNSAAATFRITVRAAAPQVGSLALPTNDLVFDPRVRLLYASVPSRAGALGNRVVAIDPATGGIGASVFVGSEPGKLALSADGQFLYVALNGAAAVRRVDLPSFTAGLQFSLGSDPFFGPYLAEDMEVLPGNPHAVAVSRMNTGVSPRHAGVAIYDDGVKLSTETVRHTGSNVITFGSLPGRLYGYNNETTEFGFRRMAVGSTGVSVVDATQNLITGFGTDIEFAAGEVFATSGRVIDPESLTMLGTFPVAVGGPIEPDVAHGKVFLVSSGAVQEFDASTFTRRQSFPISGVSGNPSSLVNIGRSDLAFRTSGDQVFLVRFQAGPDTTPPALVAPADISVDATSASGAVVSYTTPTAVDDVDGAVPVDCVPASGSTFPVGTTTVTCTASDSAGNTSTATFTVTVRPDTTAPVLTVPSNITVDATSPAGTAVGYTASAVDNVDGTVPVSCTRSSGAIFPIGTTTVTCTATDSSGNSSSAVFTVTVRGALDQIAALDADVVLLPDEKLGKSLDSKLDAATAALQAGQTSRACARLADFISLVRTHSGEKIPEATATAWIASATRIRAVIGC
jgi:DNA-binding beta-propeller fold protein YncE